MENAMTVKQDDFWEQMYLEAEHKRKVEEKMSARYKRLAIDAERGKRRWRNTAIFLGVAAAVVLHMVYWAWVLGVK